MTHCGNVAAGKWVHQYKLIPSLHQATAAGYQALATQQRAVAAQHAVQRLRLDDIPDAHASHPAHGGSGGVVNTRVGAPPRRTCPPYLLDLSRNNKALQLQLVACLPAGFAFTQAA